jgi:isopentenyl-diphosphate delta-isomerase
MSEYLVLVDEDDQPVGRIEKLAAHKNGLLHRAFSVLVFNERGQILLQRRAESKYHSGGLWSNACCGHPRPDEVLVSAARRRLHEEMGFDCDLIRIGGFVYRAELENGLTEHEFDHVFVGTFDGDVDANPDEVVDWSWMDIGELRHHLAADGERFTYWFKQIWTLYAPTFEHVQEEGTLNAR